MLTFESFKSAKSWVSTLIVILLLLVTGYVISHKKICAGEACWNIEGVEYKRLAQEDVTYVNDIITTNSVSSISAAAAPLASGSTAIAISTKAINKTMEFLDAKFNTPGKQDKWDVKDAASLRAQFTGLTTTQAQSLLSRYKFKLSSYFWLSGPVAYIEVIFWTLFGVFTSLLYYISNSLRSSAKRTEEDSYDEEEIPAHIAKMVYAPFISLIIIFGYNLLSAGTQAAVDIESSNGLLITSFVLGFYSKRAMNMLNKLKDIVLPFEDKPEGPAGPKPKHAISVAIDPGSPDGDTINNANFTIQLNGKDTTETATLKFNSDTAKPLFTGTVKAGIYRVKGVLAGGQQPVEYKTDKELVVKKDEEFKLIFSKA